MISDDGGAAFRAAACYGNTCMDVLLLLVRHGARPSPMGEGPGHAAMHRLFNWVHKLADGMNDLTGATTICSSS